MRSDDHLRSNKCSLVNNLYRNLSKLFVEENKGLNVLKTIL